MFTNVYILLLDTVFDFDESEDSPLLASDPENQLDLVFAREAHEVAPASYEDNTPGLSTRQFRAVDNSGLSESFHSLRPVSLPGPSFARPPVPSVSSSLIDTSRSSTNGHRSSKSKRSTLTPCQRTTFIGT